MSLQSKVTHAFLKTHLGQHLDSVIRRVKVALALLIATLSLAFICLLTVTTYVIILMVQGR